jgi:multidrug efflux pump subunit AcrB
MLRFLFTRPIALGMSFLVALVFSGVALWHLPVSLLPGVDVPQIVVKVRLPNASPAELERTVLRPLREGVLTAAHLQDVTSQANAEGGQAELFFEYGTNMELAYIEVNEKIDQLANRLPKGLPRPQVIRLNTSDVPVVRLQVVAKEPGQLLEVSNLAEKVVKKRLEALPGVSLVDLNGVQRPAVFVSPDQARLQALRVDEEALVTALQQNNQELGAVSVKDGQYRYLLQLVSRLQDAASIRQLAFNTPGGQVVRVGDVAHVRDTVQRPQGFHFYNGREAVVITVHKQAKAQMPDLMRQFDESLAQFRLDYPQAEFCVTQNQAVLLEAGIGNLRNDLLFGGLFAFLVLFVFIGNYRIPFLIGVILPTSFLLSFLVFYVFGISVNIISLSGLALGLGMTIDNAIIIFDHIGKKRLAGLPLLESCIRGTAEMVPPLLSSALTTQAVFVPLVFLGGLAGALAYDQAVAVGAILLTSLLVSFFLLPMLYVLLFRRSDELPREDNRLFLTTLAGYKAVFRWVWRWRRVMFPLLTVAGVAGLGLGALLPVEGLPTIERRDLSVRIHWNEALDVAQNRDRSLQLAQQFKSAYQLAEADVGVQQFLLRATPTTLQETELYFLLASQAEKDTLARQMARYLAARYPRARVAITDAPNTFDLVFKQQKTYLEARFKNPNALVPLPPEALLPVVDTLARRVPGLGLGEGLVQETQVRLLPNYAALNSYQVPPQRLLTKVQHLLGDREVTQIRRFGEVLPIQLYEGAASFQQKVARTFLYLDSTRQYPLDQLLGHELRTDYRSLTADKAGIYHSVSVPGPEQAERLMAQAGALAQQQNWKVDFTGQYFEDRKNVQQLLFILAISVALLYFILAIEFESFKLPLIVVLTLPLGFMGSFLALWLAGETLNIMSAMGLVVMLGIIDNDTILKIDAINRLAREYPLDEAIAKAGATTFKPVLMTSLTNVLALVPFLFDSGLGADLQRPFVIAIIGGLTVGTFTALYFVPLMYKAMVRETASVSNPDWPPKTT